MSARYDYLVQYKVRWSSEDQDVDGEFGPFYLREEAERCVLSLAANQMVLSAKIVLVQPLE